MTHDLPPQPAPVAAERDTTHVPAPRRKRGRPLEMQPGEVLGRIRDLAVRNALFRIHLDAPGFYARARRLFGSWASALEAAGVDHDAAVRSARRRAVETRRGRRSRRPR